MTEYCFGSYSSIPPGAFGEDYDALAEPVGDRYGCAGDLLQPEPCANGRSGAATGTSLFFAGEATNRYFPATVHGAYMSGVREASRILNIHHPVRARPPAIHPRRRFPHPHRLYPP